MKKTALTLAMLIGLGLLAGCADKTQTLRNDRNDSVSDDEGFNEADEEMADGGGEAPAEESSTEEKPTEKETEASAGSEADRDGSEEAAQTAKVNMENDGSDMKEEAEVIYQRAVDTCWKYIMGCPYELDYEDTSGFGMRVIGVDSLDEIRSAYGEVFADCSPIDDKYFEENGKVYCNDGGRGANRMYRETDLIPVSADDVSARYTAVSHYADPETKEPMDDKSYDFVIEYIDGVWKAASFTLPN